MILKTVNQYQEMKSVEFSRYELIELNELDEAVEWYTKVM